ncbi:MAG: flavodoxin family protein [Candidatus Amulumruptor caecigallinarius]|nr:flavodoxin family protein [Candidatus Amulumruptor caecigallinarius]MCM1396138.1 flavodoxin family protein [Candidatus Amulumruptor caecigallinarius]MCM1453862.1 flavodoxin family protein [bacterium]
MRLLIINGSPRQDGIVTSLAAAAADEARMRGVDVTVLNVSELRVAPCRGCMSCRTTGLCTLAADDSQTVIEALRASDAVIIATPTYWANMPGSLKVVFDRMVYALMDDSGRMPKPRMKGKRAALITACSTPWPFDRLLGESSGTVRAVRSVLRYSGIRLMSVMIRPGTKAHPQLTERDIARARSLAARLML